MSRQQNYATIMILSNLSKESLNTLMYISNTAPKITTSKLKIAWEVAILRRKKKKKKRKKKKKVDVR